MLFCLFLTISVSTISASEQEQLQLLQFYVKASGTGTIRIDSTTRHFHATLISLKRAYFWLMDTKILNNTPKLVLQANVDDNLNWRWIKISDRSTQNQNRKEIYYLYKKKHNIKEVGEAWCSQWNKEMRKKSSNHENFFRENI